jgi:hypothetical protein
MLDLRSMNHFLKPTRLKLVIFIGISLYAFFAFAYLSSLGYRHYTGVWDRNFERTFTILSIPGLLMLPGVFSGLPTADELLGTEQGHCINCAMAAPREFGWSDMPRILFGAIVEVIFLWLASCCIAAVASKRQK